MAIDPQALGGMLTGMWSGMGSSFIRWIGYFFTAFIILGTFIVLFFVLQYKYKVSMYKIEGNKITKPKWERARIVKDKGVIKWKLFLTRKTIKPIDFKYIEKGNRIRLLRTGNDTFVPLIQEQMLKKNDDGTIMYHDILKPLDEDVTYWYQLQQQQIARDYMPEDAGKKQMIIAIGTIFLCLMLCGFTVWLIFKNVQPIVSAIDQATKTPLMQSIVQQVAPN